MRKTPWMSYFKIDPLFFRITSVEKVTAGSVLKHSTLRFELSKLLALAAGWKTILKLIVLCWNRVLTQNIEGFTDFRNRINKKFNMFEK